MVDVGAKASTERRAVAQAVVVMSPATADLVFGGKAPKGDVAATVRLAAIMAAKKTAELIPLCHPLSISAISVQVDQTPSGASIEVTVQTTGPTGVEMEAMTGAAVGALTLYDMVKGVERGVTVGPVALLEKSGGRSGEWRR
jgi:cyclic pyranopterin phosphate synthase